MGKLNWDTEAQITLHETPSRRLLMPARYSRWLDTILQAWKLCRRLQTVCDKDLFPETKTSYFGNVRQHVAAASVCVLSVCLCLYVCLLHPVLVYGWECVCVRPWKSAPDRPPVLHESPLTEPDALEARNTIRPFSVLSPKLVCVVLKRKGPLKDTTLQRCTCNFYLLIKCSTEFGPSQRSADISIWINSSCSV